MTSNLSASELQKAIRRALQHLYDPLELRQNPLPGLLGLPPSENRVGQVRGLLEKAIETLKPDPNTPSDAPARRYHDVLVYRFIEQSGQKEVANDMALSLRHLQRLEAAALRALTEHLAGTYNLALTWDVSEKPEEDAPQVQQEIDWLKNNYPTEKIELTHLLDPVLERLAPLFAGLQTTRLIPNLPPVDVQVSPIQQAMQHLLGLIAQAFPAGRLAISAQQTGASIELTILAESSTPYAPQAAGSLQEGLALAESLAEVAGGQFRFIWDQPPLGARFEATLSLKSSPQSRLVLVVDDNQDTLLLLERYLVASPFTFIGTRQPEKLLSLIDEYHPSILILDVMLPGTDGWTLLSQVRQHPTSHHIPVIISTILPQEKIALMLGADAFLKKPFTPHELLTILARLA